MSDQITDPVRLAELREMINPDSLPGRCDACGSYKRPVGCGCCIVCGKPYEVADGSVLKTLAEVGKCIR